MTHNRRMPRIVDELARRQLKVGRPDSFEVERTDTELRRLTENGSVLQLSKGFYVLVPEDRLSPDTTWRPAIEGAALGMAVALYGPDEVALVGPSATRAHRCYPRALGTGYVSIPGRLRTRRTAVGTIRFVTRDMSSMDTGASRRCTGFAQCSIAHGHDRSIRDRSGRCPAPCPR
jgi:hypothetical protein